MRHLYVRRLVILAAIVGGLSVPSIGATQMTEQSAVAGGQNAVADGAKVVISFSIIVPDAHTTIADNLAQFTQGKHELLPALEEALMGMKPGEQKRIDLTPDRAFGPYDESKKISVARTELPADVKPGTILTSRDGRPFTLLELNDSAAVVDYNHPLAGKRLVFDVKVLKVEHAS
jgi:FKBP-type peptidyl-prolyl cis-trans isomerase 2